MGAREDQIEDLRRRVELSDLLVGLTAIFAEVKTFQETLELAVKVVADAFRADRCFAVTLDHFGRGDIPAFFGFDEGALARLREVAARPGGLPLIESAIDERRPVLIGDAAATGTSLGAAGAAGAYVCIPLTRWGHDLGALAVEFDAPQHFSPDHEGLAYGIARNIAIALANARRFTLMTGLRTFGLRLASRLKLVEVVEEIAAGAVDLLDAESALIYFVDTGEQSLVAAGGTGAGSHEATPEIWRRLDLRTAPWSGLARGEVVALEGPDPDDPSLNKVVVRIGRGDEGILGAVLISMRRSLPLSPEEEEALNVLAGQASLAIATATRFQQQRQVALSLQSGLLSPAMPEMDSFDAGAVYEPAGEDVEVGGDFYDVFDLHDGRFALVVGDVSGKGAEAAALMAMTKYMLRAFAFRNPSPASVLFHLNNALVEALQEERFTTVVYGVLAPATGELTIAGGGHPRPLVYRGSTASVDFIPVHGTLIGAFSDQHFEQEVVQLAPEDAFAAYTDGLIEARKDDLLYGIDRVAASLERHAGAGLSAAELSRALYLDAQEFGTVSDDTVVLAVTQKRAE